MYKRYALYSLCLISLLTLWMSSGFPLTSTNFSVIGNRGGRRLLFLLWGAFIGNYFYLYTWNLMELTGCRDPVMSGFLFAALILFVTAVGIPYVPELAPGLSLMHVWISFFAPLLLGAAQLRFLLVLRKKSGISFGLQWILLGVLGFGSALLFLSAGIVTSLLEIFVILGICLYLWLLYHRLESLGLLHMEQS